MKNRQQNRNIGTISLISGYVMCALLASCGTDSQPLSVYKHPFEGRSNFQSCQNGYDDDGDFLVDCEEMSCWGHPFCQPPSCQSKEECSLPGCAYAPQCFEGLCDDAIDNDHDTLIDCFDPDCNSVPSCKIEICDNGLDDELDGVFDCDDPDCFASCRVPPQKTSALNNEICYDALDNDQDTLFDCRDPDCASHPDCGGLREIGAPCFSHAQCASTICLEEAIGGYPGGICTAACNEIAPCPQDSVCAGGFCLSPCGTTPDCREGFSCFDRLEGDSICFPDCANEQDCPETGQCNLYSGFCQLDEGKKRDGAQCADDLDCESSRCDSYGFCISLCDPKRRSCPDGEKCRPDPDSKSNLGFCTKKSTASNYIPPWEKDHLLETFYQEQRFSTRMCQNETKPPQENSPVFDLGKVHQVKIMTYPEDRKNLVLDERSWSRADFWYDDMLLTEVGIRLKGGAGSGDEMDGKPGFSIKINAFHKKLRLFGLKKILLNNSRQDPSYLSEHMGYWLFEQQGIPAPQTAYAQVTVDGELYGLYLVVEAKDKTFLKNRLGSVGGLYEGAYGEDLDDPYDLEEHIKGDPILREELADALFSEDEMLLENLGYILNLEEFFTVWALEALFDHWDGYVFQSNNYYLYENPNTERFLFLPHGTDQLFGTIDTRIDTYPLGMIARRLGSSGLVKHKFLQEVNRILYQEFLAEKFMCHVDIVLQLIDQAARTDPRRRYGEKERELFSLWIRSFFSYRKDFLEFGITP